MGKLKTEGWGEGEIEALQKKKESGMQTFTVSDENNSCTLH